MTYRYNYTFDTYNNKICHDNPISSTIYPTESITNKNIDTEIITENNVQEILNYCNEEQILKGEFSVKITKDQIDSIFEKLKEEMKEKKNYE